MLWIQTGLIIFGILIVTKVLSGRGSYAIKAWKKLVLVLLVVMMIVAILMPDLVTVVANMVGVGRGTDLLVYVIFAVFLFYVLSQYVRAQDERDRTFRLARQVALIDAKSRYKIE